MHKSSAGKAVRATLLLVASGLSVWAGYRWGDLRARQWLRPYVSEAAMELEPLREKYEGVTNSEHGEEWILRDYFADKRDGVFVDVGANHYQRFSNTYRLEVELGWSGVAIEPQTAFAEGYARYRPRTRFVSLFVADTVDELATLYIPPNHLVASSSRDFAEDRGDGKVTEVTTRTTTLDDVLSKAGIDRFDFLSMDIELAEPAALRGFSIRRFMPALVCVEGHLAVRQEILDYFTRNGYVLVGKYLRADSHNLWFVPL